MPSRRSHTKSHHGCLQCKARRVKCDERQPTCERCAKRQMVCSFSSQVHAAYPTPLPNSPEAQVNHATLAPPQVYQNQTTSNAPTPGSVSDQAAESIPASIPVPTHQSFSQLDLELIHYYSTQTYMTLTSRLTAHITWRDTIFQQGLKHGFLLHALMATAALHKATNHAEESDTHATYIKIAFQYQNLALAGYIPALSQPTQDNAVALFVLSALLTIWLFGSKKLPEALNGLKLSSSQSLLPHIMVSYSEHEDTEFLEILSMVQGINAVVKQTIHWLSSGEIEPLLKPPLEHELPKNPPDIEASFQKLRSKINAMNPQESGLLADSVSERIQIYNERLDYLQHVSRARTVLEHDQQVFAWPVSADSSFIELMRQRDPPAIALFIHWAACFRCLDHLWWAKGWSYRLVRGASAHMDSTWDAVLAWPRKEVGLE